ncbi:MAG: hypothetical protein KGL90_13235 [Burkholderiales bacterium]|nr:hypothetical protein [Burkholderiales bacterium]
MTDEYQIEIPPSFVALYTDARHRLTVPLATVRAQYEVCEDLANHLVDHCHGVHRDIGVAHNEVLVRIHRGLLSPDSGVSPDEAVWVVTRLAELLGWAPIAFD